jgi:hypothetical protein
MKFDRVCVVSLKRRPERLEAFLSRVPVDFRLGEIEVFPAVDGKLAPHPAWWKQGGGAWGCYRSHLSIIEQCLNEGVESVLIFEDDATFCDGFSDKADGFFRAAPPDWGQAYLGGQHLKRAERIAAGVVQAKNINRTHAYALRGAAAMREVYQWLNACDHWVDRNHIDHHYGRMHKAKLIPCYAPEEWLCGQAADGKSDVSWKEVPERWWHRKSSSRPFVAVVGLHRSGSSCIAMMLHKLGVNMGDKLGGYEALNGGGGEAVGLARLCERAARFPTVGVADQGEFGQRLSRWIASRGGSGLVGGKYPHLCAAGDHLVSICGDGLKVIHCDRPLADSIDSLKRRSAKSRGWLAATDEQCEAVQRWLWEEKEKFLASLPAEAVLDVRHDALLADPAQAVESMIDFLGISPSDEQKAAAISHVIRGGA